MAKFKTFFYKRRPELEIRYMINPSKEDLFWFLELSHKKELKFVMNDEHDVYFFDPYVYNFNNKQSTNHSIVHSEFIKDYMPDSIMSDFLGASQNDRGYFTSYTSLDYNKDFPEEIRPIHKIRWYYDPRPEAQVSFYKQYQFNIVKLYALQLWAWSPKEPIDFRPKQDFITNFVVYHYNDPNDMATVTQTKSVDWIVVTPKILDALNNFKKKLTESLLTFNDFLLKESESLDYLAIGHNYKDIKKDGSKLFIINHKFEFKYYDISADEKQDGYASHYVFSNGYQGPFHHIALVQGRISNTQKMISIHGYFENFDNSSDWTETPKGKKILKLIFKEFLPEYKDYDWYVFGAKQLSKLIYDGKSKSQNVPIKESEPLQLQKYSIKYWINPKTNEILQVPTGDHHLDYINNNPNEFGLSGEERDFNKKNYYVDRTLFWKLYDKNWYRVITMVFPQDKDLQINISTNTEHASSGKDVVNLLLRKKPELNKYELSGILLDIQKDSTSLGPSHIISGKNVESYIKRGTIPTERNA